MCQIRKEDDPLWIDIVNNEDDRVTDNKLSLQTLRVCLMFHGTYDNQTTIVTTYYLTSPVMRPLEDVEEDPQLRALRELPNYVTLTTIVEEKQLQIIPASTS